MKFRDSQTQEPAELELAPMIDVVFLLLIFFLVSWQFARIERDNSITISEAEQTDKNARKKGEIIINIRKNGEVVYNDGVLTNDALLKKFRKLAQTYPNQAVVLRGDKEVKWQYVDSVVNNLKKAGIWNVAFAATKKSNTPAEGN